LPVFGSIARPASETAAFFAGAFLAAAFFAAGIPSSLVLAADLPRPSSRRLLGSGSVTRALVLGAVLRAVAATAG
jgi:hypothetical protein